MTQNIEQLIQGTIESYYDYVVKIDGGCDVIIEAIKGKDNQQALRGIIALSEGLVWLLDAESLLEGHSYQINSPISKVSTLFGQLNDAIEANEFDRVQALLEDEVKPLFKNAAEWKFEEVVS